MLSVVSSSLIGYWLHLRQFVVVHCYIVVINYSVMEHVTFVCTEKKQRKFGECCTCMASDCGSCKLCYDKP